ncbi:MAG: cobalt-zinc-cadmium efflux system membrane fusion protein [Saprospiraceae bacterium]|jgi:cobalt-zinc-cadmium efflux system membrane fusion protein
MIISKYKIIVLAPAILIFLFSSCTHDHNEDTGHKHAEDGSHISPTMESEEEHDDHNHDKTIHLNDAQFLNAEIDTGWFEMKNISEVIHANGYTQLDPQDQADVNLPISGTIKSINIIEGDYVKKGQTLVTMISLEYNKMLMDKAKLSEELSIAAANLVYLQQEFDRQETLAKEMVTANKIFQKVSADLRMEKAKINAVQEQIKLLEQTIGLVNNSGTSIISIPAPISGYITHVNVNVGSVPILGSPMFSIVNNSKMHVDLLVYEKDLALVKVGQSVRFIFTNQSNQEIKGKIYNIGKSFEKDTKSVAVHADIGANDANLIPGMYLNALIDIGNNNVQTLPEEAVIFAEGREFIYLWEKENLLKEDQDETTFARLEVKTGPKKLGHVQVTPLGEIHDGDKIVTSGAYYLQSHLQKSEGGGSHSH